MYTFSHLSDAAAPIVKTIADYKDDLAMYEDEVEEDGSPCAEELRFALKKKHLHIKAYIKAEMFCCARRMAQYFGSRC